MCQDKNENEDYNSQSVLENLFFSHFIYRCIWPVQSCQCNLATCYLIDGYSEEIDKPFKRVVT